MEDVNNRIAPKNWCFWTVVLEKSLESPLDCKEIQPVHPKGDQSWVFTGRTDIELKLQYFLTWCEELTHWKRPWCWERLRAGGEGDDRGWDGWMASPTQWTWVWVDSRSWWWTGRPGVLQFMGSQRVGHNWVTELNWTDAFSPSYWKSNLFSLKNKRHFWPNKIRKIVLSICPSSSCFSSLFYEFFFFFFSEPTNIYIYGQREVEVFHVNFVNYVSQILVFMMTVTLIWRLTNFSKSWSTLCTMKLNVKDDIYMKICESFWKQTLPSI